VGSRKKPTKRNLYQFCAVSGEENEERRIKREKKKKERSAVLILGQEGELAFGGVNRIGLGKEVLILPRRGSKGCKARGKKKGVYELLKFEGEGW